MGALAELTLTPEDQALFAQDEEEHKENFLDMYDQVIRGKRAEATYETFKEKMGYWHPAGRKLSTAEIAMEMGMQPASLYNYERLFELEEAYNAVYNIRQAIVVLADGSGNLLLTPEVEQVLSHHARLEQHIESMQRRIRARTFTLAKRETNKR